MAGKKETTSTSKSGAPKKPVDGESAEDEIDLTGGPAAVERFRARAEALDAAVVKPLHGPARLIAHNVAKGAAAVLAEKQRVDGELPKLDWSRVGAVPELGLAVAWAADEAMRFTDTSPPDVRALIRRATALRGVLLTNLDGAARAGLVPAPLVAKIYEGRGPFDTAGDCVACAGLFKKYAAALRGKTPVTAAQVNEAAAVGAKLQTLLRPKGSGKKDKAQALKDALALRDRLGTLLAIEYDLVRRAGGWLFGEQRDVKVPVPLAIAPGSRKKPARKGDAKPKEGSPS